MTVTAESTQIIRTEFPEAFHPGWNAIPGVSVDGRRLTIDTAKYFFRYTNPSWIICDWDQVARDLLGVQETSEQAIEQIALTYLREHGRATTDPAEVLLTAWRVYSYLFGAEHLADMRALNVNESHLRMLTEMGTVMALNRVEMSGEISNVGPAWMFPEACKVVYGLNDDDASLVDELYHGSWFNESRRIEKIKAHVALGGRLVHGCQSNAGGPDMAGGCVAPYGADIDRFRRELLGFRDEWLQAVRACGR